MQHINRLKSRSTQSSVPLNRAWPARTATVCRSGQRPPQAAEGTLGPGVPTDSDKASNGLQHRNVTPQIGRRKALLGGLAPFAPCVCPLCGSAQAGASPASSSPLSTGRNPLYDAYFAWNMKYGMDDYEQLVAPVKSKLFGELVQELVTEQQQGQQQGGAQLGEQWQQDPGYGPQRREEDAEAGARATRHVSILEVGIGTGPNFSFYAAAAREAAARSLGTLQQDVQQQGQQQQGQGAQVRLVGVDPNPEMLKYAREAVANTQLPPGWAVELFEGSTEALPFEDGSVDAVVVTLVLCSVPSPPAALSEIRRVLRPGGRLLLLEHVRAPEDKPGLRLAQAVLNPLQRLLADGCNLDRDTLAAVRSAGFDSRELLSFDVGGTLGVLGPHIAGIARR